MTLLSDVIEQNRMFIEVLDINIWMAKIDLNNNEMSYCTSSLTVSEELTRICVVDIDHL